MPGHDFRLPVLARNRLRAELRKHPEITKHLTADTVNGLAKGELLALADKLGIDVKAIIADVQKVPSAGLHGWPMGFVVETVEIRNVKVLSEQLFKQMQAPFWDKMRLESETSSMETE